LRRRREGNVKRGNDGGENKMTAGQEEKMIQEQGGEKKE
jgi:hypothetical protein